MPERKLSYQPYRRLHEALPDDGVANDQDFYLNREETPQTDALMAQYEEMQADLLNAKPASPEYEVPLDHMTGVMDQLAEINPTNAVRGELQRLLRLSQSDKLTEADPDSDDDNQPAVEHWDQQVPKWWEEQGPESGTQAEPDPEVVQGIGPMTYEQFSHGRIRTDVWNHCHVKDVP